jgi:hypothetical protein
MKKKNGSMQREQRATIVKERVLGSSLSRHKLRKVVECAAHRRLPSPSAIAGVNPRKPAAFVCTNAVQRFVHGRTKPLESEVLCVRKPAARKPRRDSSCVLVSAAREPLVSMLCVLPPLQELLMLLATVDDLFQFERHAPEPASAVRDSSCLRD